MSGMTIDQAMAFALEHRRAGRLAQAEAIYRQIVAAAPQYAEAHHALGMLAVQCGRNDLAVDFFRATVALRPDRPDGLVNLANALKRVGRIEEAIALYNAALGLDPALPATHINLGAALHEQRRYDDAIAAYREAIRLQSDNADAHANLGIAHLAKDEFEEAIATFHTAIQLRPDYVEAYSNLAPALIARGRLDEAVAACQTALRINPRGAGLYANLGLALFSQGKTRQAIEIYHNAIALNPTDAQTYSNLASALFHGGQIDAAVASCRKAIELRPDLASAYHNLAIVLAEQGHGDESIAASRKGLEIDPSDARGHDNLLMAMLYHPAYGARAIAAAEKNWNQIHALPLASQIQPHPNDRSPNRRLRIGYVSPDFRDHAVGRNLKPLFERHDHTQFEITCYSNLAQPDALTRRFEQLSDRWRNICGLSDERVAQQIRGDAIDVLVDLTLHTAGNRLLVFARKPAPVQMTFAGYPGSTGLTAIDYRISDPYLDPPDADASLYSERTIRLPDSFWCYDPLDCADIPVGPLPAEQNGYVTFGCLNKFTKINPDVLRLWSRVLLRVPSSRLFLMAPVEEARRQTIQLLQTEGVDPSRVDFTARLDQREYMSLYHRFDVGLDTFPYNGHTTSLDSFWMGVPVVTLVGKTCVGRAGLSQLSNLRLTGLAAFTHEQFVEIAAGVARDLPRLTEMRSTLRARMKASPLMDSDRFARNIEAIYRTIWQTWCEA